jgi:uncharacterized membrane protein
MEQKISSIVGFHISLLILLFGVSFRRSERNKLFGIRTAYTLQSDENWNYVHDKASKPVILVSAAGLLVFALSLVIPDLRHEAVFFGILAAELCVLIGTVFIRRPQNP